MNKPRQLPHDPSLPALPELFPESGAPQFVADALAEMIGAPVDATKGLIRYVRYRATKSCVMLWALRAGDGRRFWMSARMFHDDRGAEIAARASLRRLAPAVRDTHGIEAPPYRYVADRRVLLQLYPLDSRMPALIDAGSETLMSETFSQILGTQARVSEAVPVSYKPWRRCVYRYDVDVGGAQRAFYAKLFLDARGAQLVDWQRAIDAQMRDAGASWCIVPPVAHVAGARMLLLEAVDGGVEVKDMLKEASGGRAPGSDLLDSLGRIAAGIPAFQETPLESLPDLPPRAVVRDYAHGAADLGQVAPEFADSMFGLLRALDEQAQALPPEAMAPSHGAFRYDQFILKDGVLSAIDLDTLCRSGVSADAGNFLGYLDVMAVRRPELQSAIETCAATFEEAALRLPGASPEWIAWYRAAAHVKKALRAFYSLDPKWPRMTSELAEQASRTLASRAGV